MLDLNKHIKPILDACVQHTEYPHEINVAEKAVIVKIERSFTAVNGETSTVHRFITIEAEVDDRFWVKVQEIATDPVFTTMKTSQQFRARHKEDLDWSIRYVYAHIKGAVKPSMIPPKELVEKMHKINEDWLPKDDHQIELYLQGGEFGDDWRFRLTNTKTGEVICCSLDPTTFVGHLATTLLRVYKDARRRGYIEGVAHVGNAQARNVFQAAFSTAGIAPHDIPSNITDYMRRRTPIGE